MVVFDLPVMITVIEPSSAPTAIIVVMFSA
jgi:hypothetical protein